MRISLRVKAWQLLQLDFTCHLQKKQSAELSRIMGELRVDGASSGDYDEDDLLDLMDSAN